MNLSGWDFFSAVSVPMLNAALAENAARLVSDFKFKQDGIEIEGRFGPWRIVRGGSVQKLYVALPVVSGSIRGVVRRKRTDLAGMELLVEIGLRMLPEAGGAEGHKLVFDIGQEDGANGGLAHAIDLTVPQGRLTHMQIAVVKEALTDCLNAHAEQVAFVFAHIKTRGAPEAAWLHLPHHDWANLETQDGPHFLALFGSRAKPSAAMAPTRVDPALVKGDASAYFAVSNDLYMAAQVLPWLNANFRPKAPFAKKGAVVHLAKKVKLAKAGGYQPVLEGLSFKIAKGGLAISAQARIDLNFLGTDLMVTTDLLMPFFLDAKTGRVGLRRDPKPRQKHWVEGSGLVGKIVAAFISLFLPLFRGLIENTVNGFAHAMQGANNPMAQPIAWTATRDFKPSRAEVRDCLWMADDRPAPVTVSPQTIQKEPDHVGL
ncbi:TULIP family P47-like protein [Litorivita sp. NS0012-18]|uniref:TULIP family P47-like protein n=1 Tax=Litorivita sp. NS0012-18 TaxID=3127655 RepID=UPI0031051964